MLKSLNLIKAGIICLTIQLFINDSNAARLFEEMYMRVTGERPYYALPEEAFPKIPARLDDPFRAAGRADPNSSAVCIVQAVRAFFFSRNLGNGTFVNVNGQPVVITTAQLENPTQVQFLGADNTRNTYKVIKVETMEEKDRSSNGLQVLFLKGVPLATPLELATNNSMWRLYTPQMLQEFIDYWRDSPPLYALGWGSYYFQPNEVQDESCGFCTSKTPVKINLRQSTVPDVRFPSYIEHFKTEANYDPPRLITHLRGFIGAPVINAEGGVESVITRNSAVCEERVDVLRGRMNFHWGIVAVGLIHASCGRFLFDRFVGGSLLIWGAFYMVPPSKTPSFIDRTNLGSTSVQNWFDTIIPVKTEK